MSRIKVEGERKEHRVFLYTLSTCGWCKKTKQLLKDKQVEYEYIDFDTATEQERRDAMDYLRKRGERIAFPKIIIDEGTIISGFNEDAIKEALGL